MGLAHLLVHYGRRIVDRSQISFVHVNHQWRGDASDADAEFVQRVGERWGIPTVVRKVSPPVQGSGRSWEEEARLARKAVFAEESTRCGGARILTAHQADDLAETLLWRLFTGAAHTHGAGILFQHGMEWRPFLTIRKSMIQDYLREAGQDYREDSTNFSGRFLRAKMRSALMPEIEKIFPKGVQHLIQAAFQTQVSERYFIDSRASYRVGSELVLDEILLQAGGLKLRRSHLEFIQQKMRPEMDWQGELHLPDGWKLIREVIVKREGSTFADTTEGASDPLSSRLGAKVERWILEKSR
jgi:tRNA(Ile)-lysidine synthetase-like protein